MSPLVWNAPQGSSASHCTLLTLFFLLPSPHFPGHFSPTQHMMYCGTRWAPWEDVINVATYSVSSFPVSTFEPPYVKTRTLGEEKHVRTPF
jgi:hypothetical protein